MKNPMWLLIAALTLGLSTAVCVSSAQEKQVPPANLEIRAPDMVFNSSQFQTAIQSAKGLGPLVTAHSTVGAQVLGFGFAAKSPEATFFLIGSLYAEALAYVRSGDLEQAAKRLAAIETESITLQMPPALYNYVSTLRNRIELQRYPAAVLSDWLALGQPFLDEYAASQGEAKRTLFRAGTWFVDMRLAAAAGDTTLVKQASTLHYFTDAFQRLQAPQGVLDALAALTEVVTKPELTERDIHQILQLVQTIQTILS